MRPRSELGQTPIRSWVSTSGAYGSRVAISTVSKVALGAMLTTWLGQGPLTLWVLATSFGTVLSQIADAGFQHLAVRASAVGLVTAVERRNHAKPLLRLITLLTAFCCLLATGLAFVAERYWLRAYNLGRIQVLVVFVAAMVGAFIQMMVTTMAAYLIGGNRPWAAVMSTGAGMAMWAFIAGTGSALGLSLPVTTVCAQAPFVLVGLFVWRLLSSDSSPAASQVTSPGSRPNSPSQQTSGRDLVPFVLFNLAGFVISGIDVYVVAALQPELVAGYSYAIQATALCGLLCTAVAMPLVSHVARNSTVAGPVPSLKPALRVTGAVQVACVLFVGLGGLWFTDLAGLWIGVVGQDAALVFAPLALAAAYRSMMLPALYSAVGSGHLHAFVRPAVVEAGINLAVSLALGLRYGAVGVATGSLVGSLTAVLMFQNTVSRWRQSTKDGSELVHRILIATVLLSAMTLATQAANTFALRAVGTLLIIGVAGSVLGAGHRLYGNGSHRVMTV